MRFMNSSAASSIPTSMATTRSKMTVSKKVSTSTRISLLGAHLHRRTKGRHWHILYATLNRMAAIQGMGMRAA